jgi:AmmeMemoRadiSam system protein B
MERPRLRKAERLPQRDAAGEPLIVLYDRLGVAEPLAIDAEFAPLLDLLDGTRTLHQVRQSLRLGRGLDVGVDELAAVVEDLRHGLWLDDAAFRERWAARHAAFLAAPERAPTLGGTAYPEDPAQLRAALRAALGPGEARWAPGGTPAALGVVCPHSPLDMSGAVLAATLRELPRPEDIDLVVIIGTDLHPALLPYAISDKAQRTPLGLVPGAHPWARALLRRLPWLDREQVRHLDAPSIEWGVLLLQWIYGDRAPPVLPVLCGQGALVDDTSSEAITGFLAAMEATLAGARVLWWCSAELGHVGVDYGRSVADAAGVQALRDRDAACIDALVGGSRASLSRSLMAASPAEGRPSGAAAWLSLVRLLPVKFRAELARYETAAVPGAEDAVAGLAGIRLWAAN